MTKMIDAAGRNTFNWLYNSYYRKLERTLSTRPAPTCSPTASTRRSGVDRCQQAADEIAKDASITKYKRV